MHFTQTFALTLGVLLPVPLPPAAAPSVHTPRPSTIQSGVSVQRLDQIASRLVAESGKPFHGKIVADAQRSLGFAAIQHQGNQSVIFVSPNMLRVHTENTWAFVLGHELGHQISGTANSPQAEALADRIGAKLAMGIGYKLEDYVRQLYSNKNSCSPTHGCWHDRARQLEAHFQVSTGLWNPIHQHHRAGKGLPGQTQHDTIPPSKSKRRVPCAHTEHAFDLQHAYDTQHPFDTLHAFDTLHRWDFHPQFGRVACSHRAPCSHRTACGHRVACSHRVPCTHRAHAWDEE